MASSPYPELSDSDWGRLLAIGAVHRRCAPTLRQFATRRPYSDVLQKLHSDMAVAAALSAQEDTDEAVVAHLSAATRDHAAALTGHPDCQPADRAVLSGISDRLAGDVDFDDPFADLYAQCEAACAQLYGTTWLPPAPFGLIAANEHPRGLTDPYALTAFTARPVNGRAVGLKLCPNKFGPEVFAVLARVLLHELICHVGARDGEDPDPLSPFSEGLMDWASLHYLQAWAPRLCGEYATAAIMHADQSATSFKTDPGTRAARDTGEDAALLLVMQRGVRPDIARLAVDLNAADRPREPKNEFVRRVLAGTLDGGLSPLRDVLDGQMLVEALLDSF